ncbi:MAG: thioredoxin domain-containing protein [Acidobacteriota bacterium]|nr:thioredoxin domain-containing protein [Acidobacteriota bacterium]
MKSGTAAPAALPARETVDSFIRHYFGYNPSFSWKIDSIQASEAPGLAAVMMTYSAGDQPQRMRFYVTADGEHAIFGDAVPFGADPFIDERRTLEQKANGAAEGAAKPAVLIVEFSDLQCPHCKVAFPTLQQLGKEEPQAKIIFQHFPLPMHDWAQKAAQYAVCVGQKSDDAFWRFAEAVFDAQSTITGSTADTKLTELATTAGADGKATAACAALPATAQAVKRSFDLGRELKVDATPTVFINGRRISSISALPYEELKAMVEFEIKMAHESGK